MQPVSDDTGSGGTGTAASPDIDREEYTDDEPSLTGTLAVVVVLAMSAVVAIVAGRSLAAFAVDRSTLAIAAGALFGAALGFLAVTRFAAFLIVLITIRGALDGLKLTGTGGSAISEPGVLVGGVLLVACVLWLLAQRSAGTMVPWSRTSKWILAFAVIAMIGGVTALDRAAAIEGGVRVLTSALTFIALEQLLARRPAYLRGLLVALGLSLIIPAIVGLTQLLSGGEALNVETVSRVRGTFVHPNALASYLVTIALTSYAVAQGTRRAVRSVAWIVFAIAVALCIATYGRAAWIGLIVGMMYLLWKQRPALVFALLAVLAAVPFLVPSVNERLSDLGSSPTVEEIGDGNANSLAWRFEYWGEILPLSTDNPVTGLGLDQVPTRTEAALQPHSAFVQAIVETGVIGLIALIGVLVAAARDLRTARRRARGEFDQWMAWGATAVGLAFAVQMITENLLTQVAIHLYLWIPIAYATSIGRRVGSSSDEPAGERSAV